MSPRWAEWRARARDVVLGKARHTFELLAEEPAQLPLPEGSYPVNVRVQSCTGVRRWGAPTVGVAYSVELAEPIEVEGFRFGQQGPLLGPYHDVHQAVGEVVASVLRERRRRGVATERTEA